jgi:hypothetical protein
VTKGERSHISQYIRTKNLIESGVEANVKKLRLKAGSRRKVIRGKRKTKN